MSIAFAVPPASSQRLQLTPHLRAGQIFFYRIDFNSSRNMKTESRVASPQLPPTTNVNASALLQVEIVEVTAAATRIKTYYSERSPATASQQSSTPSSGPVATADKVVEVSISSNGSASQFKGFDQLSPAQQFAWNDWFGRFTASMAYPKRGIRPGEKWKTDEPETISSPLAGLIWAKKFQYVRDEPCQLASQQATAGPNKSASTSQQCAVIFVRSTLRQKSSPKNATPDDYKLRDLKTRGTVSGHNETILYISRTTGILVRSTEDAQQSMDVIIALADGSNEVHYNLDAKSHSGILLLPDSPQEAH